VHQPRQLAGKRQSDTRAFDLRLLLPDPGKGLKQLLLFGFSDADSGIGDQQAPTIVLPRRDADGDLAMLAVVFNGVGNQVQQHLTQTSRIGHHKITTRFKRMHGQRHRPFTCQRP